MFVYYLGEADIACLIKQAFNIYAIVCCVSTERLCPMQSLRAPATFHVVALPSCWTNDIKNWKDGPRDFRVRPGSITCHSLYSTVQNLLIDYKRG